MYIHSNLFYSNSLSIYSDFIYQTSQTNMTNVFCLDRNLQFFKEFWDKKADINSTLINRHIKLSFVADKDW